MSSASSTASSEPIFDAKGLAIALWALTGVTFLLGRAIYSLGRFAWEPVASGQLTVGIGVAYAACMVLMAYAEGYRGFQLRFSPKVVARAVHLANNPRWWHVVLATPFSMGLLHADRRTLITGWSVVCGVVILVIAVRYLDQPWRGVVDAGVVVGLGWGLLSVWLIFVNAMRTRQVPDATALPR